jgi:predicted nucleic acid-binding Zn ribbon protein
VTDATAPDDEPDAPAVAWQRALAAARARGYRPTGGVQALGAGDAPAGGLGGRARYGQARRSREEVTLSGARPGPRDPSRLGDVAGALVGAAGWQDAVAVGGVMGRWREVVGGEVAEHCVPVGFGDGVLTVRAATTAWATQLRMLVPDVLRRMAEVVGADVVHHVEVLAPDAPSWKRGRLSVRGRGARDTYG